MKIISFCITTYNQKELVAELLSELIEIESDEIEIVVCDDCSTENIESVVHQFNDSRIKFYCNEKNLGHDRNILKAIEHATGEYVFILRTRDRICKKNIPVLIKELKKSNSVYIVGSAIDEDGNIKLPFKNKIYRKGRDAVDAHFRLFVHPSGNIYKRSSVDIKRLEEFINGERLGKYGFVIHSLIRIDLSQKGSFQTIKDTLWIYTNTNKASDVAQNKTDNYISVYHPSFTIKRFELEYKWIEMCLKTDYALTLLQLIKIYLEALTWSFMLLNNDKRYQFHYQYRKVKYSFWYTRRVFFQKCKKLYNDKFDISYKDYLIRLDKIFRDNLTLDFVKFLVKYVTRNTRIYRILSNIYKTHIKEL